MKFFKPIALVMALTLAFTSCKKEKVSPAVSNKIAFIYKTDNTDAAAFRDLLQANNSTVTLVEQASVASFDFSSYKLIVVGHNTPTAWTDADANAVKNSGKQLLLIGQGGAKFAEKIGNTVNWGTCAGGSNAAFLVTDPTSNLYKSPKSITVPGNNQLNIFTVASSSQEFHAAVTPVPNVILIGKNITQTDYHPVTYEKSKYAFFGYYDNVNAMTATGKNFMVNLVYSVGNLSL